MRDPLPLLGKHKLFANTYMFTYSTLGDMQVMMMISIAGSLCHMQKKKKSNKSDGSQQIEKSIPRHLREGRS